MNSRQRSRAQHFASHPTRCLKEIVWRQGKSSAKSSTINTQGSWSSFCLWISALVVILLVGSLPGRNSARILHFFAHTCKQLRFSRNRVKHVATVLCARDIIQPKSSLGGASSSPFSHTKFKHTTLRHTKLKTCLNMQKFENNFKPVETD